VPSVPILAITDGTTRVILTNDVGLYLRDWRPGRPLDKKVRREPAFGGGAQVVMNEYGNVIDTLEFGVRGHCQNYIITDLQNADRLLQKAVDYWASTWTAEPVWLEAKGPDETNTRYATIRDYAVDGMANPYSQPFFAAFGPGGMNELTLAIEHDIWQADVPGTATCVKLSHSKLVTSPLSRNDAPTESGDDAYTDDGGGGSIDTGGNNLLMGADAAGDNLAMGIRFRTIANIPQGATILNAYILFYSNAASAGDTCNIRIYGDKDLTPAVFSTYADFWARTRTTAYVDWLAVPHWANATSYATPNIANIIQELVSDPAWVANGDITLFLQDHPTSPSTASASRQASSWDAFTDEPVLYIIYASGDIIAGIHSGNATCLDVPHIVNHHNWEIFTNADGLTHAFTYDTSLATFGANIMTAALPQNLLPAAIGTGDMLYVGAVDTATGALDDRNVFDNVIFNVGTVATYAAGDSSAWEYWNGAAWAALTVYDDTSANATMTQAFGLGGIRGIHFGPPSNWAATIVNTVPAYWVRCVITETTAVTTPTQQAEDIFTCRWSCVDIDGRLDALGGDIPALARWRIHPRSDRKAGDWINGTYSVIYMGLRSFSRELNKNDRFSAYWPAASDQRPKASTQTYYSPAGTTTAEALDYRSPYGGLAAYWATGAAASAMANIILIRQGYAAGDACMDGSYHMFVRYRLAAGAVGDVVLGMHSGTATAATQKRVIAQPTNAIEVADFGRVQLGAGLGRSPEESDGINIYLQAEQTVAAARNLYVYDVILIPADEWYAKLIVDGETGELIDVDEQLDSDSVLTPKNKRLCVVRDIDLSGSEYLIYWDWTRQGAGPNILQANEWQRVWFFSRVHANTPLATGNLLGTFHLSASVRCEATARYLSMRGSR